YSRDEPAVKASAAPNSVVYARAAARTASDTPPRLDALPRCVVVPRLADDISLLRDGKVVASAPAGSFSIDDIVRAMVGRDVGDFYPARETVLRDGGFEVENLSADNGVDGISFAVRRGEIVGMAGLVGAGRTETADAIFGIAKKTAGTIKLDGRILKIASPRDAIAQGIGYLTEDRKRTGLCLALPSGWNITLPNFKKLGMRFRIALRRENKICRALGEKLHLKWASPDTPAESLSGGNQQKVLLGRWLQSDAEFLIVDEPARGIDVGAKKEMYILLDRLAREGKAILFISSELPELFGVCDRILVMRDKKIVGDFPTGETSPEKVIRLAATGNSHFSAKERNAL
ncbi:MAG: sugar ABC transporter ATP-binding protein, partial [Victivallaceae bacterium]|nr:sugar ABC transporter ATP-binding protein [Victivallaceae bacterium]